MNKFNVWFSPGHCSVNFTTKDGVQRNVSANNMVDVLKNMDHDDLRKFVEFCSAVVECVLEPNCKKLQEF